jgi:hypothetical protein
MCPKTKINRDKMKMIPYTLNIGFIIYTILCTRSYISYALSIINRYQSNPMMVTKDKNILKYLRRTKNTFLVYGGDEIKVHSYLDASS